jgi:hypothetical protein
MMQFHQPEQTFVDEDNMPFAYDSELQLNVMADGSRAADDGPLMLLLGTTTSTAGSKTHFDD